ncbi:MAG: hypothetical protein N2376_05510, partial [Clostridia bacterium]|nr:hypothetical protein [Clostridia bacterium]
ITALADLAGIPWLSVLCGFLPFYWVTQVALKPISLLTVVLAILVYGFWLCLALFKVSKR